eukprot:scaffold2120_cov259-Pinguiococcus_pyrenoidosus.AAC.9
MILCGLLLLSFTSAALSQTEDVPDASENQFAFVHEYVDSQTGKKMHLRMRRAGPRPIPLGGNLYLQKDTLQGHFLCDVLDAYISRNLLWIGEFEVETQTLLQNFVQKGDLVIDVGANIGIHSVGFSKMVGETGVVLSFEPQDRVYKILNANLVLNQAFNVRALKYGIGEQTEILEEVKVDYNSGTNVGAFRTQLGTGEPLDAIQREKLDHVPHHSKEYMTIEKLDNLYYWEVPDRAMCPSVIKIDIEGELHERLEGLDERLGMDPQPPNAQEWKHRRCGEPASCWRPASQCCLSRITASQQAKTF